MALLLGDWSGQDDSWILEAEFAMESDAVSRGVVVRRWLAVLLVVGLGVILYESSEGFSDGDKVGVRIPAVALGSAVAGLVIAWGLWQWPSCWRWWSGSRVIGDADDLDHDDGR